jgi:Domain of unknown function (DUF5753)
VAETNAAQGLRDYDAQAAPMPNIVELVPPYIAADAERGPVVNPFLAARKRGWWDSLGKGALVDDALVYVELEDEATAVRTFKIDLVDGLMQTSEYAAALIRANQPHASESLVRRQVDARMRRQARLRGENPLRLEMIITEGALRIAVGGPAAMRRQLDHLLALMELPNVDVRVVPVTGAYPAMGTPFYILSFDDRFPDVGYVELLDKGVYLEEPDDVRLYATKFAGLRAIALDPEASGELIATIGASLR